MLGFHGLSEAPLSALAEAGPSTFNESASNSITFVQNVNVVNELSRSASNSVTFSQQLDNNFKLESASNAVTFGQQADNNFKLESVSNSATFAQQLNSILEKERFASNDIAFGQVTQNNVKEVSASNSITFSPFVDLDFEINLSLSHNIQFDQQARKTIDATASTSITFTQDASQEHCASTDITFGQTVVGSTGPAASNNLTFGQTVSINFELGVSVSTAIVFTQPAIGFVEENCDLYEYTPFGNLPAAPTLSVRDNVELSDGTTTLNLRNPEFENVDEVETYQVVNQSRGGTYNIFASSTWPNETTLRFTVTELTRALALNVQNFYTHNLGKEITLIDQEDRTWTGILLNVDVPIIDSGGNKDQCRYSIDFEFIGETV